jgi:hypothetical protein
VIDLAKKPDPPLHLVDETTTTPIEPPRTLNNLGRSLWDRIQREYAVHDAGGVELLLLACEGIDRIGELREAIERDGPVIRVRGVPREHPALKAEVATMAFVTRTLARLGLQFEPVRPSSGRPGLTIGWQG